jgi:hypothetical protein
VETVNEKSLYTASVVVVVVVVDVRMMAGYLTEN